MGVLARKMGFSLTELSEMPVSEMEDWLTVLSDQLEAEREARERAFDTSDFNGHR
jgi:hypothetical protein